MHRKRIVFTLIAVCVLVLSAFFAASEESSSLSAPSDFSLETSKEGVVLSWSVLSVDAKTVLWRAYDHEGPWFIYEMIDAGIHTYMDEDLDYSTQYFYRIQSLREGQTSGFSNVLSAMVVYDGSAVSLGADEHIDEIEDPTDSKDLFTPEEYERRMALHNQAQLKQCELLITAQAGRSLALDICYGLKHSGGNGGGNGGTGVLGNPGTGRGSPSDPTANPSGGLGGKGSPASPGGNGGDGGNGGGSWSGSGGGGEVNGGDGSMSNPYTRNPNDPCDATFRRVYGYDKDCRPRVQQLEEDKELLELLTLALSFKDAFDTNKSMDEQLIEYLLKLDTFTEKRAHYEVTHRKAMYEKGMMLEQRGMYLQSHGDADGAMAAFEQAQASCLRSAESSLLPEDEYPARLCAARTALKHAMILGPKDPLLQDAQREYTNLAQKIDLLEDSKQREKFLPLAIEAYSGLVHAEMREGKFSAAEAALKQAELLAPKSALVKHMHRQFDAAKLSMIARTIDHSKAQAYDLLNAKLRTDESLSDLALRTRADKFFDAINPFGGTRLDFLTEKSAQEHLKLTDEQIGLALLQSAVQGKGKTLDELRGLSIEEVAALFGVSDMKRAQYAQDKIKKAFENVDLEIRPEGAYGGYQFETGQGYLSSGLRNELDDSVRVDESDASLFWRSVGEINDQMFSMEGIALNFLPYAAFGKAGLALGTTEEFAQMSAAGALVKGLGSAGAIPWKATTSLFPALDDFARGANSWVGSNLISFKPLTNGELMVLGTAEQIVIGVGGSMLVEELAPGSGVFINTFTGEFMPLTHLAGSAVSAASRAGIRTIAGQRGAKDFGVDFVKSKETGIYEPSFAKPFDTKNADTQIFYDGQTGKVLATSSRTAFDEVGNPIPLIEFTTKKGFDLYVRDLKADGVFYRAPDGSRVLAYVKGKEPLVLPDAKANELWFRGGRKGETLVTIGREASTEDLVILAKGLDKVSERVYALPFDPAVTVYFPKPGEELGIVGATPNDVFVRREQTVLKERLASEPYFVRNGADAPELLTREDIRCSGDCFMVKKLFSKLNSLMEGNLQGALARYDDFSSIIDSLPSAESQLMAREALAYLKLRDVPIFYLNKIGSLSDLLKYLINPSYVTSNGIFLSRAPSEKSLQFIYHETAHVKFNDRFLKYSGKDPLSMSFHTAFESSTAKEDLVMIYDSENNRLLFPNEIESMTYNMHPLKISKDSAHELNSFFEEMHFSSTLGNENKVRRLSGDTPKQYLIKVAKYHQSDYFEYDWSLTFLSREEFALLNALDFGARYGLLFDLETYPHSTNIKIAALRHLEKIEANLPLQMPPEAIAYARGKITSDLAPYRKNFEDYPQELETYTRALDKLSKSSSSSKESITPQGIVARALVDTLPNNPNARFVTAEGIIEPAKNEQGTLIVDGEGKISRSGDSHYSTSKSDSQSPLGRATFEAMQHAEAYAAKREISQADAQQALTLMKLLMDAGPNVPVVIKEATPGDGDVYFYRGISGGSGAERSYSPGRGLEEGISLLEGRYPVENSFVAVSRDDTQSTAIIRSVAPRYSQPFAVRGIAKQEQVSVTQDLSKNKDYQNVPPGTDEATFKGKMPFDSITSIELVAVPYEPGPFRQTYTDFVTFAREQGMEFTPGSRGEQFYNSLSNPSAFLREHPELVLRAVNDDGSFRNSLEQDIQTMEDPWSPIYDYFTPAQDTTVSAILPSQSSAMGNVISGFVTRFTGWATHITGFALLDFFSPKQEQAASREEHGRGFIAQCNALECATVPVLIELDGKNWQLGYYPENYGADGKARLSYRSDEGEYLLPELS